MSRGAFLSPLRGSRTWRKWIKVEEQKKPERKRGREGGREREGDRGCKWGGGRVEKERE